MSERTPSEEGAEARGRSTKRWGTGIRVAVVAALLAVFALLAWATFRPFVGDSLPARVAAGKRPPAPGFNLEVLWPRTDTWPPAVRRAISDGRVDLTELRGRPLVVNFWASWCLPCREEAPLLNAAARASRGRVVFLGVDVRDLRENATAFSREFATPYASVRDRSDRAYRAYGLTGVPETFFIDASGRVVAHVPGVLDIDKVSVGIQAARSSPSQ